MVAPRMNPLSEDELGRRLAAARAYKRMTLAELGERMKTHRDTLSGYEKGVIPREKRAWLVEDYGKETGLPPEFFSVDLKRLPEMYAAWRQVQAGSSTPEDLARELERDEAENLPPGSSESQTGEQEP